MESLVEPRFALETWSTNTEMSHVLPTTQDAEPSSTTPEGEQDPNSSTTPSIAMNGSVSATVVPEATSGEPLMTPQTAGGMPPLQNRASGAADGRQGNEDGGSAIKVDVEEEEEEDEDGSRSSEASDGHDLNVCQTLCVLWHTTYYTSD